MNVVRVRRIVWTKPLATSIPDVDMSGGQAASCDMSASYGLEYNVSTEC